MLRKIIENSVVLVLFFCLFLEVFSRILIFLIFQKIDNIIFFAIFAANFYSCRCFKNCTKKGGFASLILYIPFNELSELIETPHNSI